MKTKKIRILKKKEASNYVQLIKWIRTNNPDWGLHDAVDWVKSLPQTIGPFNETDFEKVSEELFDLVKFEVELVEDTMFGSYQIIEGKLAHVGKVPEDLKDAEEWFSCLSKQDQARVNVLRRYNGPYG